MDCNRIDVVTVRFDHPFHQAVLDPENHLESLISSSDRNLTDEGVARCTSDDSMTIRGAGVEGIFEVRRISG